MNQQPKRISTSHAKPTDDNEKRFARFIVIAALAFLAVLTIACVAIDIQNAHHAATIQPQPYPVERLNWSGSR